MTTAEITITFTVEFDGTNNDLIQQLVVEMRKTADRAENNERNLF